MMYCKASSFHGTETQRRIMAINDAVEQKQLSRAIHEFVAAVWDRIKSDVVVVGNRRHACKNGCS